jgi:hypothetical protein
MLDVLRSACEFWSAQAIAMIVTHSRAAGTGAPLDRRHSYRGLEAASESDPQLRCAFRANRVSSPVAVEVWIETECGPCALDGLPCWVTPS